MMKRHPFILLEVLIATLLLGSSGWLSIHAAFRLVYQQQKVLQRLEESLRFDQELMDLFAAYWKKAYLLTEKSEKVQNRFVLSASKIEGEKIYLLKIKDIRSNTTYSYCVHETQ